jgi:putative transposase
MVRLFHKDGDYTAFLDMLTTAKSNFSVKVLGVCLMPNHFHLVVQPATEATLCSFMQWLMTSHARCNLHCIEGKTIC